jgi:uncharacterized protein YbjT (DUF2867 family)
MKISVIITGVTGMVGEGVLMECLAHPNVERVLIVNRKHFDVAHPKLKELIVPNFFDLSEFTADLTGYNACFFCAGISSVGMTEPAYTLITYDLTLHFAQTVVALNPDMVFAYVSGALTDSTEQGKVMWARVKGKTENALLKLPFKKVYNFRPGFMKATAGQKNVKSYYKYISWMYPLLKALMPNHVSTLKEVGLAMINAVQKGYPKPILEIKDIKLLALQ